MSPRFKPPAVTKLDDPKADRVRVVQDERIRELQRVPITGGRFIEGIELEDNTATPVAHGLGRKAAVLLSPPRGAFTTEYQVGAAVANPVSAGNWFAPNGTADYWEYNAGVNTLLHIPIHPLWIGMHITTLRLSFYRGDVNNPTISLYGVLQGATADFKTPTAAWTNPGASTTWTVLEASYDETVTRGNRYVVVEAANAGDRVRGLYVTIDSAPEGTIEEIRDGSVDATKNVVLKAKHFGATVTVDAWCF